MTRPRYQKGSIVERNGNWVLKYYDDRIDAGVVKRVRISKILAPVGHVYRTKSQVRPLADEILSALSSQSTGQIDGTLPLSEFIEKKYFPHLELRQQLHGALHLEPSTVKGYKDIWKFRVKDSDIASLRVRNFTTVNAQAFFMNLSQKLSHQTHLRVKAFLSGVFSYAKQIGAIAGVNPLDGTKVGGRKSEFKGQTYTLDQILDMLEKLPEPARTVCATAAFTGLSASELRGLQWQNYDGEYLHVSQKVWRRHVGAPKTEARRASVPVIPALKKILDGYKAEFPPVSPADFIFLGQKGFALNLDNLSRDTIAPIFPAWSGWHSFRRGIGTRLFYLGADAKTVQTILRHSQVSTTMAHYVMPDQKEMNDAMKKYEDFLAMLEAKRGGPVAQSVRASDS